MADKDALKDFDFNKVTGSGLFIRFKADVPITVRILTTDPVISQSEFTNKQTGEITVNTKFSFIVWNWTEEKAQILSLSPNQARKVSEIHRDPDFGADIRKLDIKIMPTGEGLDRRYEIQVLPENKARVLTKQMIEEAKLIDLDKNVKDSRGRMSEYKPEENNGSNTPGYDKAKAAAQKLNKSDEEAEQERADKAAQEHPDPVVDVEDDEPINLDDIPF